MGQIGYWKHSESRNNELDCQDHFNSLHISTKELYRTGCSMDVVSSTETWKPSKKDDPRILALRRSFGVRLELRDGVVESGEQENFSEKTQLSTLCCCTRKAAELRGTRAGGGRWGALCQKIHAQKSDDDSHDEKKHFRPGERQIILGANI